MVGWCPLTIRELRNVGKDFSLPLCSPVEVLLLESDGLSDCLRITLFKKRPYSIPFSKSDIRVSKRF